MHDNLILAAGLILLGSTIAFGMYLMRFSESSARAGRGLLIVGTGLAVAALLTRAFAGELSWGVYDGLLSCGVAVAGLTVFSLNRGAGMIRGAFLAPVLMMVFYSLHVVSYESSLPIAETEVAFVTPIHKIASLLGFLIFAVAAFAAVIEIVQEYRLKTKQINVGQVSRLPSLRRLENLTHRALIIGFPFYSIGVALGAIWFAQQDVPVVSRHLIMASVSWVLYAMTLYARVLLGWKGRRAALLTLSAFFTALFVVLLSLLRWGT